MPKTKADRQPGPGKTECPNCAGAFFKSVQAHQKMARCDVPAGLDREASTQLPLEGTHMAGDCIDCKLKDRDLVDRDKAIAQLEGKTPEPQVPNLATALTHAQQGGCPDCVGTLQTFTQETVAKALTEISDEALRGLAIERGVIPSEITVEIPQGAHHG